MDIESREALVLALNDYSGAVILVSHDTHLVETVADRLWLVKDGHVRNFEGDMHDYKKLIMAGNKTPHHNQDKKAATPKAESKKAPAKKVNPQKLQKEIADLEARIERLNKEKTQLEVQMADADFYAKNDSETIAKISTKLSDTLQDIEASDEQWLLLQDQL